MSSSAQKKKDFQIRGCRLPVEYFRTESSWSPPSRKHTDDFTASWLVPFVITASLKVSPYLPKRFTGLYICNIYCLHWLWPFCMNVCSSFVPFRKTYRWRRVTHRYGLLSMDQAVVWTRLVSVKLINANIGHGEKQAPTVALVQVFRTNTDFPNGRQRTGRSRIWPRSSTRWPKLYESSWLLWWREFVESIFIPSHYWAFILAKREDSDVYVSHRSCPKSISKKIFATTHRCRAEA